MNFFTFQYWFSYYPEAFLPWAARIVFFWFSLVLIAGALLRYFAPKNKDRFVRKLMSRMCHIFLTYSLVGFFFLFLTQQTVPLFGARFWYVILDIGGLVWLVLVIRHYRKTVPELRKRAKERAEFEKYLP